MCYRRLRLLAAMTTRVFVAVLHNDLLNTRHALISLHHRTLDLQIRPVSSNLHCGVLLDCRISVSSSSMSLYLYICILISQNACFIFLVLETGHQVIQQWKMKRIQVRAGEGVGG